MTTVAVAFQTFHVVNMRELKILQKIKTAGKGYDGISTKVLRDAFDVIENRLIENSWMSLMVLRAKNCFQATDSKHMWNKKK